MIKQTSPKSKISRKKKVWLITFASLMVIILVWWAWGQFAPRPLGDRLEYLGKTDSGNWLGFDSFPSSTYYYETDMTTGEIVNYFTRATVFEEPHGTDNWQSFALRSPDGEIMYFYTYTREAFQKKKPEVPFTIEKRYILSISDSKYNAAKDSL